MWKEEFAKKKNQIEFKDTGYKWEYKSIDTGYSNSIKKGINTNSDVKITIAAKPFVSASSLLNNKPKTNEVDVSIYKAGQNVYHKKFGEGIITKAEVEGNDMKLDINFEKSGKKRLMARFANLEIM